MANGNRPTHAILPLPLLDQITDYLVERKFKKVAPLINAIQQQARPYVFEPSQKAPAVQDEDDDNSFGLTD